MTRTNRGMGAPSRDLEARVRIELTIEVLQTSALPLGYRAGQHRQNDTLKTSPMKQKALAGAGLENTGAGDGI